MTRYHQILRVIEEVKPQSICEIGTWNGRRAISMINHASAYHSSINYTGYDLFEEATQESDKEEFNVKNHNKLADVLLSIKRNVPKSAVVWLRIGNTRQSLKRGGFDLVWLDGGHSVETIRHDFDMIKHSRCILLDDYYTGAEIDTDKFGCNFIREEFGGTLLPVKDRVAGGGHVQILRIDNV